MGYRVLTLCVVLLCVSASATEAQLLEWASAIGGPGTEEVTGITVDSAGNLYTVGAFDDTVDFDPGPGEWLLTAPSGDGNFLMKQDSSGELQWAMAFPKFEIVTDVTVDEEGGIYLVGKFHFTIDFDPGPATQNRTSAGSGDIFALKLDATGAFEWVYTVGAGGLDTARAVDLLPDRVIVAGDFQQSMDFDPGPGVVQGLGADAFAVSLSRDGTFEWAALTNGLGLAQIWALATDGESVYVGGNFDSSTQFGDFLLEPVNNAPSIEGWDAFMAKVDAGGEFVWAAAIASQEFDRVQGIAGDSQGNAIGVGFVNDVADLDPGPGELIVGDGGLTPFLVKLDTTGQIVWGGVFDTFGSARGVAVDGKDALIIVGGFGSSGGGDFDPGPGVRELDGAGGLDGFVVKLDAGGGFDWAGNVGGALGDDAVVVHIDPAGHLFVAGHFEGMADLDPGSIVEETQPPGFGDDLFLLRIRPLVGWASPGQI